MEKPQQWQRVKQIVGSALERQPVDRGAFLDEVCSQDTELRAEVESLLAAYRDSDDLSKNPWVESTEQEAGPKVIGPYCLLKELGIGGMGQVWLAQQTEPVRRPVALKLIKAGMYDASTVQRFKAERQSLAIMDHPAIAKVFDAGTTATGQPYLVMEYVDGRPITEYCDSKKLGIRARLELFIRVCEGVRHAHQKAIIHRDLKPSNILVVEVDGKPRPRIIDFGLAKTAAPQAPGETLFTQIGAFLGTPGYMSPEQADPDVHDIDTRTDVYSLGAVLYELLTGSVPFPTKDGKRRPEEIRRQLREEDPPRPSTKIGSYRGLVTARALARNTDSKQLTILLRGDLDWITLRALERERERRYPTPSALAADIQNYLQNRPVSARPANVGYHLRKYIRRHAAAVAVAGGAVLLLLAFAIMQGVELRRITRERERADRITEFMTNMFNVSDPSEARGNTITAREILDRSSKEIDTGLSHDPELKAQMLDVMGNVYDGLGLYTRAERLLRLAVDSRTQALGPEHLGTLTSGARLAQVVSKQGKYGEAEKMERELLQIDSRALGRDHRATLKEMSDLAWTLELRGQIAEAEKLCREVLLRQQRALGVNDADSIESSRLLGVNLESQRRFREAENNFRLILDVRRRVLGPEHPLTLKALDDLGVVLTEEDRYGEAEQVFRQTLDISSRVLGADHPDTLITMGNLATVFESQDRYPESEKLQREVLARCRRTLGPDHPFTALALYNIADVLYYERNYSQAAGLLRETVDIQRRILGSGHPDTVDSTYKLARDLVLARKTEESISVLSDAVHHGVDANAVAELEKGANWKSLRRDRRFIALVRTAETASQPPTQKRN
jgi:eukaryotic-like serine/threonine-protein kinase